MAKQDRSLVEVICPCCEATLRIDPATAAVITHKEKVKPHPVEDLAAAVQKLKGEEARREEVFQKQMADQKNRQEVLNRKFDELFKQAKEDPDMKPRTKDIDL
jgi:hypothetical protein